MASKILKLKAVIYRYTGVFLAYKEESEYLQSDKFWKEMHRILSHKENDLSAQDAQGILIGSWQADIGFHRPMSFMRYRRPRAFWKFVSFWVDLFKVIQWDIESLIRGLKKKLDKKA